MRPCGFLREAETGKTSGIKPGGEPPEDGTANQGASLPDHPEEKKVPADGDRM